MAAGTAVALPGGGVAGVAEETGQAPPRGPFVELGEIRQKSAKRVLGWAAEGDLDPTAAHGNNYEMEWPPGSGRIESFP